MDSRLDALLAGAQTFTAFADHQHHLGTDGDLAAVVEAARRALAEGGASAVTIYDDVTGERTEFEPDGDAESVGGRFSRLASDEKRAGPGRPKLGVVSREVSLLPRHWEWLAGQPGGASAALRRLVEEARKRYRAQDASRVARDAAHKAMFVLAGDQPGLEEAMRALYAGQFERVAELTSDWPSDLGAHVRRLVDTAAALDALAREEAEAQGAHPSLPAQRSGGNTDG